MIDALPTPIHAFVSGDDTPEVNIPALVVGRLIKRDRTVYAVLIQTKAYSGSGPVNVTAVNPYLVVHR